MQAKITYMLSETAQRAQMVATGQPVARKQEHTIEISAEEMRFCEVAENGLLSRDLAYLSLPEIEASATPEEAWDAYVRQQRKQAEKEQAAKMDRESRRMATEAADGAAAAWVDALPDDADYYGARDKAMPAAGVAQPNWSASTPLLTAALGRLKSRNAAAEAAKERAEADKETAKVEYLHDWIMEYGDESQRARSADKLLPRKEALAALAEASFTAGAWPVNNSGEKIVSGRAENPRPDCTCEDCDACETEYRETEGAPGLSAEEYAAYSTVRAAFPDATLTVMTNTAYHTCSHRGGCGGGTNHSVRVALPVGPFTLTREYAL